MIEKTQQEHSYFQIKKSLAKGWQIVVCPECGSAKYRAQEVPNHINDTYDEIKYCYICATPYEGRPTSRQYKPEHQLISWNSQE